MPDYEALYTEIQDPKYSGMSDEEIAASINAEEVTTPLSPAMVSSGQLFNAMDRAEFTALDAAAARTMRDMWTAATSSIDIAIGTIARGALDAEFPAGTATSSNVLALTTLTQTLAQSMGFTEVTEHEIAAARSIHEETA